jgi:hypothetical protein
MRDPAMPPVTVGLLAILCAALGHSACSRVPSGPELPAPSPSPSPTLPAGKPDGTAFDNLQFVRDLEQSSGRRSDLVFIGGGANLDGRVPQGLVWRYQFAEGGIRVVEWSISATGRVTFFPNALWSSYRLEMKEISASLALDSPAIISSALRYGGQAYVDRFPGAKVEMFYGHFRGIVYSQISFFTSPREAPCELGPIVVSAQTGELLTRELSCLDLLSLGSPQTR